MWGPRDKLNEVNNLIEKEWNSLLQLHYTFQMKQEQYEKNINLFKTIRYTLSNTNGDLSLFPNLEKFIIQKKNEIHQFPVPDALTKIEIQFQYINEKHFLYQPLKLKSPSLLCNIVMHKFYQQSKIIEELMDLIEITKCEITDIKYIQLISQSNEIQQYLKEQNGVELNIKKQLIEIKGTKSQIQQANNLLEQIYQNANKVIQEIQFENMLNYRIALKFYQDQFQTLELKHKVNKKIQDQQQLAQLKVQGTLKNLEQFKKDVQEQIIEVIKKSIKNMKYDCDLKQVEYLEKLDFQKLNLLKQTHCVDLQFSNPKFDFKSKNNCKFIRKYKFSDQSKQRLDFSISICQGFQQFHHNYTVISCVNTSGYIQDSMGKEFVKFLSQGNNDPISIFEKEIIEKYDIKKDKIREHFLRYTIDKKQKQNDQKSKQRFYYSIQEDLSNKNNYINYFDQLDYINNLQYILEDIKQNNLLSISNQIISDQIAFSIPQFLQSQDKLQQFIVQLIYLIIMKKVPLKYVRIFGNEQQTIELVNIMKEITQKYNLYQKKNNLLNQNKQVNQEQLATESVNNYKINSIWQYQNNSKTMQFSDLECLILEKAHNFKVEIVYLIKQEKQDAQEIVINIDSQLVIIDCIKQVMDINTFIQYKKGIFDYIKKIEASYKQLGYNQFKIYCNQLGQSLLDYELINSTIVFQVDMKNKKISQLNSQQLDKIERVELKEQQPDKIQQPKKNMKMQLDLIFENNQIEELTKLVEEDEQQEQEKNKKNEQFCGYHISGYSDQDINQAHLEIQDILKVNCPQQMKENINISNITQAQLNEIIALCQTEKVDMKKQFEQIIIMHADPDQLEKVKTKINEIIVSKDFLQYAQQAYPQNWIIPQDDNLWVYELQESSKEFQKIEQTIMELYMPKIERIQRVQNLYLYDKFICEKRNLEKEQNNYKEQLMFFGSVPKHPYNLIIGLDNGFVVNKFAKQESMGKGLYFYESCRQCLNHDGYKLQDDENYFLEDQNQYQSIMVICASVLVGNTIQMEPDEDTRNFTCAPFIKNKDGSKSQTRYDSITYSQDKKNISVIYNNNRAYPSYLITFKHKK